MASGVEAILCLGTDFHHKNRVFALRILERLNARHDWEGVLVLAGPTVGRGSSREREAQWLAAHPQMATAVLDVGAVSEAEKAWLTAGYDAPIGAGRDGGPAARAASRIRRAITGLSAVIDARILYGPTDWHARARARAGGRARADREGAPDRDLAR